MTTAASPSLWQAAAEAGVGGFDVAVLAYLESFAWDKNVVWPGDTRTARALNRSVGHVRRVKRRLEEAGLIVRFWDGGLRKAWLTWIPSSDNSKTVRAGARKGCAPAPEAGSARARTEVLKDSKPKKNAADGGRPARGGAAAAAAEDPESRPLTPEEVAAWREQWRRAAEVNPTTAPATPGAAPRRYKARHSPEELRRAEAELEEARVARDAQRASQGPSPRTAPPAKPADPVCPTATPPPATLATGSLAGALPPAKTPTSPAPARHARRTRHEPRTLGTVLGDLAKGWCARRA